MIDRLGKSFEAKIGEIIVKQVEAAYDVLGASFKYEGAYDKDNLLEMIQKVEAKAGKPAVIHGTKLALANLKSEDGWVSEVEKEEMRNIGHVGMFHGAKVVEIPQSLNRKDEFMINDAMLYVIPDGTKIVKLLFEGDVDVIEVADPAVRKDMQFEYMFMRRLQIGVCKSNVYGIYAIQ